MIIQEKKLLVNENIILNNNKKYFKKLINLFKSKYLINFICLCILYFGKYFYIKSLNGCDGEEFKCMNINLQYIIDDINYCLLSGFCFLFCLFLIQMKYCSIYQLFIFVLIIIYLILKDHGDSIKNHGLLNLEALFLILLFGEIIILILILIIVNIKKKRYISVILVLVTVFLIFYFLFDFLYKDKYYCKNWDIGLNNTHILNDKSIYPCSIEIPKKKCLISIIGPFLDFSKFLKIKCEKREEKEKYYLKDLSNLKNSTKDIKRIGFPITIGKSEEIKGKPAMYSGKLFKFVINNLIDMDDNQQLNKLEEREKPEIIIDYNKDPYGKLEMKINYNDKLSIKRKLLETKENTNNILFIFLDNLSRVHFYRQYKKTSKFLEKFLTYDGFSSKEEPNQKYHGFEFLKYHKFNGATLGNAIPMFSGVYYLENNTMISIVKDLKKLGYITCNVQDICHKELMDIGELKGYSYIEFDHEYAAPSCDPTIYYYGFDFLNGENGILRKCLYGKDTIEQSLIYAKKFWNAYKDNKKFLRIVNTYAHEYIGEKSKYADNALYNFLNDLYSTNSLKNTTVFLAADHGFALMGIYEILKSKDYDLEFQLPFFILLVPDMKNLTYEQQYLNIYKNQQNFITSFDIYYTIRNIIYGNNYKKGILNGNISDGESLFNYINPKERLCSKYKKMLICKCIINK